MCDPDWFYINHRRRKGRRRGVSFLGLNLHAWPSGRSSPDDKDTQPPLSEDLQALLAIPSFTTLTITFTP